MEGFGYINVSESRKLHGYDNLYIINESYVHNKTLSIGEKVLCISSGWDLIAINNRRLLKKELGLSSNIIKDRYFKGFKSLGIIVEQDVLIRVYGSPVPDIWDMLMQFGIIDIWAKKPRVTHPCYTLGTKKTEEPKPFLIFDISKEDIEKYGRTD